MNCSLALLLPSTSTNATSRSPFVGMTLDATDTEVIDLSMSSPGPIPDSPVFGGPKRKATGMAAKGRKQLTFRQRDVRTEQ